MKKSKWIIIALVCWSLVIVIKLTSLVIGVDFTILDGLVLVCAAFIVAIYAMELLD